MQVELFGAHKCFVRARVKHYAHITPRVYFNPTFVTLRESKAHSECTLTNALRIVSKILSSNCIQLDTKDHIVGG